MAHIRLFNHYIQTPLVVLGALELVLLLASAYAALYLRFGRELAESLHFGDEWFIRCAVFAVVMLASTAALGVYQSYLTEGFASTAIRTVVSYCLVGTAALTILYYGVTFLYLGRGVLFFAVCVSLILVLTFRYLFFIVIDGRSLRRRIAIFGAGEQAAGIQNKIADGDVARRLDIVACIDPGSVSDLIASDLVVPVPPDWVSWVGSNQIDEIVVAPDERRREEGGVFPVEDLLNCKMAGVRVIEGVKFLERETGKLELDMVRPGWLLFSEGYSSSYLMRQIKRVLDIVLSLLVLFLVWPLMIVAALGVYLESGRPVIYRQRRVGLNGKEFELLKFRSMVANAEQDGKAVWAAKNDHRITRVGQIIRNLRIDELPQLYNVLKGEMSFVGPRPERPEFISELQQDLPLYGERHRIKPGLMGWAQLNYPYGASVHDAAQKLRYDLYYIKNYSVLLDIIIIVRTVEVILLGKGVH